MGIDRGTPIDEQSNVHWYVLCHARVGNQGILDLTSLCLTLTVRLQCCSTPLSIIMKGNCLMTGTPVFLEEDYVGNLVFVSR